MECRVVPLRDRNTSLLQLYDDFFSTDSLQIVDLSRNVLEIATRIRANFGLKTPDALQAACCLSLESQHLFLTEDRAFSKIEQLHCGQTEQCRKPQCRNSDAHFPLSLQQTRQQHKPLPDYRISSGQRSSAPHRHALHHLPPFGWLLEKNGPCARYLLYRSFTNTLVRAECVAALRQSDRLDMWFALRRVMLKFF